jgi:hypothetical protein
MVDGEKMKRTFFSQVQDDMMKAFYADNSMATMKAITGRSECSIYNRAFILKLSKSQAYLDSPAACRLRREQTTASIACRFQKGQKVWNKGMKGLQIGGQATQFKKGTKPPNHKPAGTIREVDGYFEIKVAEGMHQWRLLHRVIWERCNGPIPKGHIVIFLDGNTKNINIKNMALLTKAENMKRNTVHNYPKEIVHLVQLRAALNRQINKRTNHEQPRP